MKLIRLPTIPDPTGDLTVEDGALPFLVKRVFWLHSLKPGAHRAGHAHRELEEVIVAVSGSFSVRTHDEHGRHSWFLDRPDMGLYLPPNVWRYLADFSSNAIALVLASTPYDPADYQRDYAAFVAALPELGEDYLTRRSKAATLDELQATK